MADVDQFLPTEHSALPDNSLYLLEGVDRGDDMANWSPDEALPAMIEAQRTPLTLTEGIHWLLQCPDALERGKCFMTIGSRLRKPNGETRFPHPGAVDQQRRAATDAATEMHRKSAGAGPATVTPGSGSRPRAIGRRWGSRQSIQPHKLPKRAERIRIGGNPLVELIPLVVLISLVVLVLVPPAWILVVPASDYHGCRHGRHRDD